MVHATVQPFAASLRPSRLWLAWVVLTHTGLLVAVIYLIPQWAWLIACIAPFTFWYALASAGWLPGRPVVQHIQIDALGRLSVSFNPSLPPQQGKVLDNSFISNWLIILNLEVNGRLRSLLILNDSAPEAFRRSLRVYLRWFPIQSINKTSVFQTLAQRFMK